MGSSPDVPETTAAQKAFEIEQQRALSKEIEEENRRKKALARGQLGSATLLGGVNRTTGIPETSAQSGSASVASTTGASVLDGATAAATPAGVNKGTPRKMTNKRTG